MLPKLKEKYAVSNLSFPAPTIPSSTMTSCNSKLVQMLSPLCNSRDESDGNLTDAVGIASGLPLQGGTEDWGGGVSVWFKALRDRLRRGTAPRFFHRLRPIDWPRLGRWHRPFFSSACVGQATFFLLPQRHSGSIAGGRGDGKSFVRGGTPRSERGIRAARITLAT